MPLMTNGKRDFKKERLAEKPARKEARKARGRARTKMGLKDGDPRVVDHKKELSRGGSNDKSNLRVTTKKANDAKEARRRKKSK